MPDDLSGALEAASIVVITITTLSIAMRLWIRSTLKTIGVDDYLVTGAWVLLMGLCTCVLIGTKNGFGTHHDEVFKDRERYHRFLRCITGCSATFSCGVSLAKSSFAVLYLRIQPNKKLQIANKILIAFLTCQAIEEACLAIFACTPVASNWNTYITKERCLDLRVLWWTTFVFNMSTDLFLFIQPIPSMWKLQLPLAKRIGLICMLSLGLLVCVTSIIRIVYVTRIGGDDSYDLAEPMIWSEVELAALIVCSTIPCLRQVVQKVPWLNHALGLSSHKSSQPYYGQSGTKKTGSIPLKSYNQSQNHSHSHRDYLQSKSKSNPYGGQYGMTSHATASPHTKNDSTEEIFPHKTDGNGAIIVTHEVVHDIESHTTSSAEGSMRHDPYYEGLDNAKGRTVR